MITGFVIGGLIVTVTLVFGASLCRAAATPWPDIPDDYDAAMDEQIGDAFRAEAEAITDGWEPWMNGCDPDQPCGTHWDNDADRAHWMNCANHPPARGRHHRKQSAGQHVPIASITDLADRRGRA